MKTLGTVVSGILNTTQAKYPKNHKVGMKVPKGGSDCAKCEYWDNKNKVCKNSYFRKLVNKYGKIGASPDEYCCDFFEA
jgi:hypothetical protein